VVYYDCADRINEPDLVNAYGQISLMPGLLGVTHHEVTTRSPDTEVIASGAAW
jgi:hypothetical protein